MSGWFDDAIRRELPNFEAAVEQVVVDVLFERIVERLESEDDEEPPRRP